MCGIQILGENLIFRVSVFLNIEQKSRNNRYDGASDMHIYDVILNRCP